MSSATTAAIRHALEAGADGGLTDSDLRPAARMVCDDARASGLRAEQMLVALKTEWGRLLENSAVPRGTERIDLTGRFITLCISEFYAGRRPTQHDRRKDEPDRRA